MSATEFDEMRRQAVESVAMWPFSKRILERFPRLVAHRSMSDVDAVAYTDYDLGGAVCAPVAEAMLLMRICRLMHPIAPLEIGAYVGWTTAHLIEGLSASRPPALTVIDPFTETGNLQPPDEVEARFWHNLTSAGFAHCVNLIRGKSPEVLPICAPRGGWDLVFVDGCHQEGQPSRDVLGLLPHLSERAVVVLHDGHIADVRTAAGRLESAGFTVTPLLTANLLTVAWRHEPSWWSDFMDIASRDEYAVRKAVHA